MSSDSGGGQLSSGVAPSGGEVPGRKRKTAFSIERLTPRRRVTWADIHSGPSHAHNEP
jgi:hypothetical protein